MAIKLSEVTQHSSPNKPSQTVKNAVKPWQNIPKEKDLLELILQDDLPRKHKLKRQQSAEQNLADKQPKSLEISGLSEEVKEAVKRIYEESKAD